MITRRRFLVGSAVGGATALATVTLGLKWALAEQSEQVSVQLPVNALDHIHPVHLKCEYLSNPEGVDMQAPRFYWQLASNEAEQYQTGYQLLVASSEEPLDEHIGDVFDSGKLDSDHNTHIVFQGEKLKPAAQYFWKVRVWDKNQQVSQWSETAKFSTGLFTEHDWQGAQWVAWKTEEDWETNWWQRKAIEEQTHQINLPSYFGARMSLWERYLFHHANPYDPAPLLRKEFNTSKAIKSAKAFIAGIGYHELYLNGEKVGDHVLDPGWTNYAQSILYVTHDITEHIKQGKNAVGVMLGRGNYGLLANDHWGFWKKGGYIGQPKLKCLLKVSYIDGTEEYIVSDVNWKVTGGPVVYDCPHMGEIYDATKEVDRWNHAGIDDSNWDGVQSVPAPGGKLKAQLCEPIRVVSTSKPIKIKNKGKRWGQWGDAGTNLAGWLRLRVDAPKGTRILLYFGEKEDAMDLKQPGGLQQMAYVAKGEPGEIAECRFSYKGFRYFIIKGHQKPLTVSDIDVCQVNSDVTSVGHFQSSNDTLNAIHQISDKAMISNLHSLPTDCPHREKNGWLGDAVTGLEMGMANYDLAALTTKFIHDIFDAQHPEHGGLPNFVPARGYGRGKSSLWGSACVYLPYYMYCYYGDTRLIEQYWHAMMHFTESVWAVTEIKGKPGLLSDRLSDWSSPFGNKPDEGEEVYATMNFYRVLTMLTEIAAIIDKKQDIAALRQQQKKLQTAVYKYCFDPKTVTFHGLDTREYRQGPNALALHNGIVKPEHHEQVLKRLIKDISVDRDNHIYGGIFTGHALWELLPNEGYSSLAYQVAVNDSYPGYGFMLKNGATTLWEHWPDKSSHIHYFMGFVDNYFHRHLAGIDFDTSNPGFKHIIFKPQFIDEIDFAKGRYQSIHGEITAQWQRDKQGNIEYKVTIPVNCRAKVLLASGEKVLPSGNHNLTIKSNNTLIL